MAKRGTLEHPKTLKLARRLGIQPWMALGLLEGFWHWCSKYAITGEIKSDPEQIADGIRYTDDPQAMFDALVECGWIDCVHGRYFVHDVSQHADNTWKANLKRACLEFAVPSQQSTDAVATERPLNKDRVTTQSQRRNEPPKPEPEPSPNGVSNGEASPPAVMVLNHFNSVTGRKFTLDGGQGKHIKARLREGATVEQMNLVADFKTFEWKGNGEWEKHLAPETVFGKGHWEKYLQNAESWDRMGRKVVANGKHQQTSSNYRGAYE